MFKKFTASQNVSSQTQVKTSVARAIRSKILEQYPTLEPYMDDILPKKGALMQVKCTDYVNMISYNKEVLFFQERDGPYCPTLRLLHKYPFILPKVQVDTGAIKFVLSGANIMCPGLTSPGGRLDTDFGPNTVVAVMAENKEHALAIGFTKMTRDDIMKTNKGIGIDNLHYLNDGLWLTLELE